MTLRSCTRDPRDKGSSAWVLAPSPVEVRSMSAHQVPSLPPMAATGHQIAAPVGSAMRSRKSKSVEQISSEILKDFAEAGEPKTLNALEKRIQWRFGPEPAPEKVAGVMATLVREGAIKIIEGAVEYRELRVERQVWTESGSSIELLRMTADSVGGHSMPCKKRASSPPLFRGQR